LLNYPVSFMQSRGQLRGRSAIVVFLFTPSIFSKQVDACLYTEQAPAAGPHCLNGLIQAAPAILLKSIRLLCGPLINLDILAEQDHRRLKSSLQGITGEVLNLAVFTRDVAP
jgi:hypothetical protein